MKDGAKHGEDVAASGGVADLGVMIAGILSGVASDPEKDEGERLSEMAGVLADGLASVHFAATTQETFEDDKEYAQFCASIIEQMNAWRDHALAKVREMVDEE